MDYMAFTKRGLLNAEFFITRICNGKAGETMMIVGDEGTRSETDLLSVCAKKLGLKPFVVDVSAYGISRFTPVDFEPIPALKAAAQASDICVTTCLGFAKILGSAKEMDGILTGQARCFALWARNIWEWDFDFEEIMAMRRRTVKIRDLIKKAKILHFTTAKGTDLICKVGEKNMAAIYEVLAIVPFFGEVAIIPNSGTVNGVAVIDGAATGYISGGGVRRDQFGQREIGMEPIRLEIKDGKVVDYSAAPLHKARLEEFLHKTEVLADQVDEIGIVTTTADISDEYQWRMWDDGSHHSRSFHIALGNNTSERKEIIHAKAHCDFDIHDPVIELDGHVIYRDGRFDDEWIDNHA
ncbi:MAG: hypothetical protein A2096_00670 [Spirochaetes bacterium GWF1_41_5]|nr:MAG: hypothetical protein A2096_00670 [Spirochaetes bacterium GWF1_41_5]HBE04255.1 hypothetical protein [Spirochaetia bacterium]